MSDSEGTIGDRLMFTPEIMFPKNSERPDDTAAGQITVLLSEWWRNGQILDKGELLVGPREDGLVSYVQVLEADALDLRHGNKSVRDPCAEIEERGPVPTKSP